MLYEKHMYRYLYIISFFTIIHFGKWMLVSISSRGFGLCISFAPFVCRVFSADEESKFNKTDTVSFFMSCSYTIVFDLLTYMGSCFLYDFIGPPGN